MTDRYIRFSETEKFRWCRRSWLNAYYLGLAKPVDPLLPASGKRDVGTIVDLAFRDRYGGLEIPLLDTWARLRAEHLEAHGVMTKEWEAVFSLTERMLEGYDEWLADEGADAGEITVGTEVELVLPMGNFSGDDVYLVIHIDRVVLDTTWNEWIIDDTKTVDQFEKDETFAINDQLVTYAYVWNRLFPQAPVRKARQTMLRKVKRTGTAKPPFYKREAININDEMFAAHEAKLHGILSDMVRVYQDLDDRATYEPPGYTPNDPVIAYPTPNKDCGWKCDFVSICVAHDDGSDLKGLRSEMFVPYPQPRKAQP